MRGDTSQASAISSTVVPSNPWRVKSTMAASLSASRVRAFLRSRRPTAVDMKTILTQYGGWQQLQLAGLRYLAVAARMAAAWRCSTSPSDGHSAEQAYARRWWTLAVLCLSLLIVFGGNSTLNVALPTLSRDLGATESQLQWVVAAYSLVFAGMLFTSGALGDRFGRKGALQFGLGIFFLASLVASQATNTNQIIACRAVMGLGAAFIMPSTLSILVNVFPPSERAKAIAIWATTTGIAGSIGPIITGYAARALLVRLGVPRLPPGDRARARRRLVPRAQVT